jgi:hypothetical protein
LTPNLFVTNMFVTVCDTCLPIDPTIP